MLRRLGQSMIETGANKIPMTASRESLEHKRLDVSLSDPLSSSRRLDCGLMIGHFVGSPSVSSSSGSSNCTIKNKSAVLLDVEDNRLEVEAAVGDRSIGERMSSAVTAEGAKMKEYEIMSDEDRSAAMGDHEGWTSGYSRRNLYSLVTDPCERDTISRSLSEKWEYTCDI